MSMAECPDTKRVRCTPIVFTFPAPEYDSVEHWGMERWTMEEIETLFAEMERDGIKLILPTTGAGDKVWYPSKILQNQTDCDWIGRLFNLAAGHGMEVILSGVSYTYHLQFQGQPWDPQADLDMNKRICNELYNLYGDRPNLWGWYIPHETGDRTHRGDVMTILRGLPPFLKRLTPNCQVAHSPWFTSHLTVGQDATTPAEFAAEWDAMLCEIEGIDVLAIQDSTAPFEEIGDWFKAVAPVFERHNIELWSTVELFPRDPQTGYPDMTRTIDFRDMKTKMQVASPYVQNFACWEYQNYLNPHSPLRGARKLSTEYRAYLDISPQV